MSEYQQMEVSRRSSLFCVRHKYCKPKSFDSVLSRHGASSWRRIVMNPCVFRLSVAQRAGHGAAVDAVWEDGVCCRVSVPGPGPRDAAGACHRSAQRAAGPTHTHTHTICFYTVRDESLQTCSTAELYPHKQLKWHSPGEWCLTALHRIVKSAHFP